ncbi:MAG: hypothetical protein ACI8XB_001204 [Patiriisocius sp.]
MKYLFLICILFTVNKLCAQENQISIRFAPTYNQEQLFIGQKYFSNNTDSISFETLRFYISELRLQQDSEVVYRDLQPVYLIDLEDTASLDIPINLSDSISYNKLSYKIGLDSLTNVSGALGGDLDPTKGMYWTWQSGYINFKMEGYSPKCTARNNKFQFHIGGYQNPYPTIQNMALEINENPVIKINISLDKFINKIDLGETHTIMSPGNFSKKISQYLPHMFSLYP